MVATVSTLPSDAKKIVHCFLKTSGSGGLSLTHGHHGAPDSGLLAQVGKLRSGVGI